MVEKAVKNLVLDQDQLASVKQILSGDWVLAEVKEGNESVVHIELV